jgi:hypothetical protein
LAATRLKASFSTRPPKRSTEELWQEIGELLATISPNECNNYFASSGYVSTLD